MEIKPITILEAEYIDTLLSKEYSKWGEEIYDFSARYPNKLESCLATPFQTFSQKDLYPGLVSKAAMLFYLLVKNHPFKNGNKRFALAGLLVFFHKNKKWLKTNNQELNEFVLKAASSDSELKDQTLKEIQEFLNTNMVDL